MTKVLYSKWGFFILSAFFLPTVLYGEPKNIFFLYSNPNTLPWTKELNTGIDEALSSRTDWDVFSETMDINRVRSSMNERDWYDYISKKYTYVRFDAVLAEGGMASHFINTYGQDLFGDIPKVLHSYERLEPKPHTYYFENQQSKAFFDTIEMATRQNPGSKKIVIINGNAKLYNAQKGKLQKLAMEKNIVIDEISNFSMDELLYSIKHIRGKAIVLYFLVSSDNTGMSFIPWEVLSEITKISPNPIYTFWSSFLDTGCAGGVMVDSKTIALEMFKAIDDYYQTGQFETSYQTIKAFTNWNAIKRYNLNVEDPPNNIEILNKPLPIFKMYFAQIMTVTSIMFALFFALALYSRFRIVTAGKKIKNALEYQNRLLQQQEMLKNDLVEASKLSSLGMMVAGISHELNTPVGAAMLVTTQLGKELTLFEKKFETGLSRQDFINYLEESSKGLKMLHNNHERAISLITSFKRLAFERSNQQVHTFPLVEAIEDLTETILPRIKYSSISLTYKVPRNLIIKTIYGPLSQVLQNLVVNAIEHAFSEKMEQKGIISIEAYDIDGDSVAIEVNDSGSGIDPEIREKIFDPFVTSRRKFGNTGLGLNFVHQWVTKVLKGTISVDSPPGNGTKVKITIPKELSEKE